MTPAEVHVLAVAAGLDSDSAVIATAIAWAESNLNPNALGDVGLADATWGPSMGLWQVRSLKADAGTGRARDADRLFEPAFNARAMVAISAGGTNWTPWSVWKNGRYAEHLAAVRAAVEGSPMEEWMPGVEHVDRGGSVPVQDAGPTVIVLHTTETDHRASYSGTEPHFEIDRDGSIRQYISLAHTAKALYNYPGTGVETNRRRGRIFQWELVNRASEIHDISDAQLDGLAESLRWVDSQRPFAKTGPPQGWFGSEAASEDADARFSFDEWEAYSGICGHQHVPENDHWDPGHFPLDRLLARLVPATPAPKPERQEEDDTMRLIGVTNNRGIFLVGTEPWATGKAKGKIPAVYIGTPEEVGALAAAGVAVRDETKADLPEAVFDRRFVVVG